MYSPEEQIQFINHPDIQSFIQLHLEDSLPVLMLKKDKYPGLPLQWITTQIACLKKARHKIPGWISCASILYTPLALEQCSSELTAKFKSGLLQGKTLLDLTGGFGVDTFFLPKNSQRSLMWSKTRNLRKLCAIT